MAEQAEEADSTARSSTGAALQATTPQAQGVPRAKGAPEGRTRGESGAARARRGHREGRGRKTEERVTPRGDRGDRNMPGMEGRKGRMREGGGKGYVTEQHG